MSLTEFIGTQAVCDRISETFPNEWKLGQRYCSNSNSGSMSATV